jgi:hypothetical protein
MVDLGKIGEMERRKIGDRNEGRKRDIKRDENIRRRKE